MKKKFMLTGLFFSLLFASLPALVFLLVKIIFNSIPLWLCIVALIYYLVMPIILKNMYNSSSLSKIINEKIKQKIENWDFKLDEEEEKIIEHSVFAKLFNDLKSFFSDFFKRFSKIQSATSNLKNAINDVIDSSEGISEIAEHMANGSTEQAEEVERCASLSEDLASSIDKMVKMSDKLINDSDEMRKVSDSGTLMVNELSTNSVELQKAINEMIEKINVLTEKAANIGSVTEVMYDVAEQTNLLALNASIEAARAGEAGRGFAVVANEIKKLSDQSREASADISEMIRNITEELNTISNVIGNTDKVFEVQKASVSSTLESFGKIHNFIEHFISEQRIFTSNFNSLDKSKNVLTDAIGNIATITQQTSATSQELASLTMTQHNATNQLLDLTEKLEINVSSLISDTQKINVEKVMEKKKKFTVITDSTNEFWKPMEKAVKKSANAYNIDVDYYEPGDRTVCVKNQKKYIEKAVSENVDGIAISCLDDEGIKENLKMASKKGIKIVLFNSDINGVDKIGVYETNGENAGRYAAQVAKKLIGSGKILVGRWKDLKMESIQNRLTGFVKELENDKSIQVNIVDIPSALKGEEAKQVIEEMLTKNPDTKLIFATNISWAINYAKYKQQHNKDFRIVTIDYVKNMENFVENRIIDACIAQRPFVWGEIVIKRLIDSLDGKKIPEYEDTGVFEINKTNLAIFKNNY